MGKSTSWFYSSRGSESHYGLSLSIDTVSLWRQHRHLDLVPTCYYNNDTDYERSLLPNRL